MMRSKGLNPHGDIRFAGTERTRPMTPDNRKQQLAFVDDFIKERDAEISSAEIERKLKLEFKPPVMLITRRCIDAHLQKFREKTTGPVDKASRGRPPILDQAQIDEIVKYFDMRRDAHMQSTWETCQWAVQCLFVKAGQSLRLYEYGGNLKVSETFCREFMRKNNIKRYAETTDRTVNAEQVKAAAEEFFPTLKQAFTLEDGTTVAPERVYNMDEFFLCCDQNGRFTYIRRIVGTPVALQHVKFGFTGAITTNAAGEVLFVTACHSGKSVRGEVDDPDAKLLWQTNTGTKSHMFNAEVFKAWRKEFMRRVRQKHPEGVIVLILDSASQHDFSEEPDVRVVKIPPKMTHYFQPADQYIIANLRKWLRHAAREHEKRTLCLSPSFAESIVHMASTSIPLRRNRYCLWLLHATKALALSSRCVIRSWDMVGIREQLGIALPEKVKIVWKEFVENSKVVFDAQDDDDEDLLDVGELPGHVVDPIPLDTINSVPEEFPAPAGPEAPPHPADPNEETAVTTTRAKRGRPAKDPNSTSERKKAHQSELAKKAAEKKAEEAKKKKQEAEAAAKKKRDEERKHAMRNFFKPRSEHDEPTTIVAAEPGPAPVPAGAEGID